MRTLNTPKIHEHIEQELTPCRRQEVRSQNTKEIKRKRATHVLDSALGGIDEDMERNQPSQGTHVLDTASGVTGQDTEKTRSSEGHSLSGDSIRKDKSGRGKKPSERGVLTSWRPDRKGKVRTRKETDQARGAHSLETKSAGASQNTEIN